MSDATRYPLSSPYGGPQRDRECSYGECQAETSDIFNLDLCDRHAIAVYREVRALIVENQETALPLTIEAMVEDRERRPAVTSVHPRKQPSLVYFIAFADRIKIGTTRNLGRRLGNLPVDDILATTPGDHSVEAALHAKFASARIRRTEWFTRSPELLAFIESLQPST